MYRHVLRKLRSWNGACHKIRQFSERTYSVLVLTHTCFQDFLHKTTSILVVLVLVFHSTTVVFFSAFKAYSSAMTYCSPSFQCSFLQILFVDYWLCSKVFFCVFNKCIFLQCTHSCCVRYTQHHYFSNAFVQNSLEELLFFQWRLQGLSGMARAPLQMGNRNCLIQIKICHLKFLQQVFCAPHNHWLGKAASVLTQRPCLMRFVGSRVYCTNAHYDETVVVSHSTTVIYCDWTITLACHIYKKTSSYSRCL